MSESSKRAREVQTTDIFFGGYRGQAILALTISEFIVYLYLCDFLYMKLNTESRDTVGYETATLWTI